MRVYEISDLIRVGSEFDGGYVVSERSILSSDALLSFGIEYNWDFEKEFIGYKNINHLHAYDFSVSDNVFRNAFKRNIRKSILKTMRFKRANWAMVLKSFHNARDFSRTFNGKAKFFKEKIGRFGDPGVTTLQEAVSRLRQLGAKRIFLKCDIEGSEFDIWSDIIQNDIGFTAFVIEFHFLEKHWQKFESFLNSAEMNFYLVHAHANNSSKISVKTGLPEIVELTYVNKSLFETPPRLKTASYPIPNLDAPNLPFFPDLSWKVTA